MNNSYYITSEKNSVFINQRLEAFHKSNHSIELVKKTIIKKMIMWYFLLWTIKV